MRRVLVVGCGKRVLETALPAFLGLPDEYRIEGILARKERAVEAARQTFQVTRLADLDQARLDACDLVYSVVGKHAVPTVLRTFAALDPSRVDLLIDTPVLLFKHMGHLGLLERFRGVSVPEDCTTLPVLDAIDAYLEAGALGKLERVLLDRSGYAYHAIAMGRRLLGTESVQRARRTREPGGGKRTFHYAGGGELVVLEPRDYALGRITLEGTAGRISDDPQQPDAARLAAHVEDGRCTGFSAGDHRIDLSPAESALMGTPRETSASEPGVTIWMDGMKRVGFRRLLQRIVRVGSAYPLAHAVEDTVVDYHLEKLGRYRATPLTRPDAPLARALMRALTAIAGR